MLQYALYKKGVLIMVLNYSKIDVIGATVEELKEALLNDQKTYGKMLEEISNLEGQKSEKKTDIPLFNNEVIENNNNGSSVDKDFEEEVDYYYQLVKELDNSDVDNLIDILPSIKNYNYQNILLRICAELYYEVCEIDILLDDDSTTLKDIREFADDIRLIEEKIDKIKSLALKEYVEENVEEEKKNNIVFLPTLNGMLSIIDDISRIDIEYYDAFCGLLKSIQEGTFKNVRRFVNNNVLSGLCEVKDFKTRIIFRRVNKDTYVVIGAFIKKTDNDAYYRQMVGQYYDLYKSQEKLLKESVDNPEFMERQKAAVEEIFNILQFKQEKIKFK